MYLPSDKPMYAYKFDRHTTTQAESQLNVRVSILKYESVRIASRKVVFITAHPGKNETNLSLLSSLSAPLLEVSQYVLHTLGLCTKYSFNMCHQLTVNTFHHQQVLCDHENEHYQC